jgi:hypothetical protein
MYIIGGVVGREGRGCRSDVSRDGELVVWQASRRFTCRRDTHHVAGGLHSLDLSSGNMLLENNF